jgi:hypothetical protein
MSDKKPDLRKKDSYSELLVLNKPGSATAKLFDQIMLRIATHHFNRCVIKLVDAESGTVSTFNIYPGDGDPSKFERRRDQLNWTMQ